MALNQTFIDALMQMRRKATLQGRPMTQAETAGVTEGMASSASERLARAKAADQGDVQLDIQNRDLLMRRDMLQKQADIAAKMMRQEKYKNYATTGLITVANAPQIIKGAQSAFTALKGIFGF